MQTLEDIVEPPSELPLNVVVEQPSQFPSLTITKTDTLQRMASPSIAPEIFTMNAITIRNHYDMDSQVVTFPDG